MKKTCCTRQFMHRHEASPVRVHPVAEEVDEHEHQKREGVLALVQPGQHHQ